MEHEDFLKLPIIKFKQTHPDAVLPVRKSPSNTGFDLTSVEDCTIPAKGSNIVPVGLTVAEVPFGVWYLILPRSGMGFNHGIQPHLGVIDNNYRGDLAVKLYNFSDQDYIVEKGDRVAQLAYFPLISLDHQWSDKVQETDRGANGFGHSGR